MLSNASLACASKAMSLGSRGHPYAGHSPIAAMGGVTEYTPSYVLWLDWRAAYGVSCVAEEEESAEDSCCCWALVPLSRSDATATAPRLTRHPTATKRAREEAGTP